MRDPEETMENKQIIKFILDYSDFKQKNTVVFRVVDINEMPFVRTMTDLCFIFLKTCQTYSKVFKLEPPSFNFSFQDLQIGMEVKIIFVETTIDEEHLKQHIHTVFAPEIDNLKLEAVEISPRMDMSKAH